MDFGSMFKKVATDVVNSQKGQIEQKIKTSVQKGMDKAGKEISKSVTKATYKNKTVKFDKIPQSLEEMMAMEGSDLKDPFYTVGFFILCMNLYSENKEKAKEIYDYLNGPANLATIDEQFMDFRLPEKAYIFRSYFEGAKPENNYTPTTPYTLHISENAYSHTEAGYLRLLVDCNGADTERIIVLRQKGEQWFMWDGIRNLLVDVKTPAALDDWA